MSHKWSVSLAGSWIWTDLNTCLSISTHVSASLNCGCADICVTSPGVKQNHLLVPSLSPIYLFFCTGTFKKRSCVSYQVGTTNQSILIERLGEKDNGECEIGERCRCAIFKVPNFFLKCCILALGTSDYAKIRHWVQQLWVRILF